MKIRDIHAVINGDKSEIEMPNDSLEIIASDGRSTLFRVTLMKDGQLEINAGQWCKHNGVVLQDRIHVIPHVSNVVTILRPEYKKPKVKK